jgi:hypothetical protein
MSARLSSTAYRMSFTMGGLFLNEAVAAAMAHERLGDWTQAQEEIQSGEAVGFRKTSSMHRAAREVATRLKQLTEAELALLRRGTREEQAALLWLAVCRTYRLIGEFAIEQLQERFLSMRPELEPEAFGRFIEAKAEWHKELATLKPSTRQKLQQVLFRILREAGLLSREGQVQRMPLSKRLLATLGGRNTSELAFFPGAAPPARRRKA